MSYVIVNVGTERLYRKPGHFCDAIYETESGAKGSCTRLNKEYGNVGQWKVIPAEDYHTLYPVKMVERINLLSGKPYMEAEDTPNFCSPASEAYWSC